MTPVLLTNAYSSRNAGDGLLVRLALEMLGELGVSPAQVRIIAADPLSFDQPNVVSAPAAHDQTLYRRAWESVGALALPLRVNRLATEFADARSCFAVGGGYLRFGHSGEAFKAAVGHLTQIRLAGRTNAPTVLLPQSIGPIMKPLRPSITAALRAIDSIHVRDDRSANDLSHLSNVTRTPDLGVLEVARSFAGPPHPAGGPDIAVVLRALPRFDGYRDRVAGLLGSDLPLVTALQSAAGSGNNDEKFFANLGRPARTSLKQGLDERRFSATVSVRLHGAIQSIMSGVPSVHLSYERKGFAAFEDLGLSEYVHNARTFDPAVVAVQLAELASDPSDYFARVATRVPKLMTSRRELLKDAAYHLG